MHIGILITNTDHSPFAQVRPSDGEKINAILQPLRPDWTVTAVDVQAGIFPKSIYDFDGYVISGSPASVNDNGAWIAKLLDFIRALDLHKVPTCRYR